MEFSCPSSTVILKFSVMISIIWASIFAGSSEGLSALHHDPTDGYTSMTTAKPPSSNKTLEPYDADFNKNSISLRFEGLNGIEKYVVSIGKSTLTYNNSQGLQCSLWEKFVCIENFPLPEERILLDSPRDTLYEIRVSGQKGDIGVQNWTGEVLLRNILDADANKPTNVTWNDEGHGIVTVKWGYPSLPKTKIERFNITIQRNWSNLLSPLPGHPVTSDSLTIEGVQKEYTKMLQLMPSTEYIITITSVNQIDSGSVGVEVVVKIPSSINFTKSKFEVGHNGTLIELKIPAVVNVTKATRIKVSIKGIWRCGTANNMMERIVWTQKVESSEPMNKTFDANKTTTSDYMIDCFLNHGEKYKINVKIEDEISNTTSTLPAHFITLPYIDGQTTAENHSLRTISGIAVFLIVTFCCVISIYGYKKYPCKTNRIESVTMANNDEHQMSPRIEREDDNMSHNEQLDMISIE